MITMINKRGGITPQSAVLPAVTTVKVKGEKVTIVKFKGQA